MAEAIGPLSPEERLARILGSDELLAQAPTSTPGAGPAAQSAERSPFVGNVFEDILARAVDMLNDVSRSERYADQMVNRYLRGEVELHEVMTAQSKMSIMVQLAVTTINTAVTTFKEITQMQV
jgi:flagellar hook-basal body complex protein FliE